MSPAVLESRSLYQQRSTIDPIDPASTTVCPARSVTFRAVDAAVSSKVGVVGVGASARVACSRDDRLGNRFPAHRISAGVTVASTPVESPGVGQYRDAVGEASDS
jgi:hypothetical protein